MTQWYRRRLVVEALLLLPFSQFLVRSIKIGRWSGTLEAPSPRLRDAPEGESVLDIARQIGRSVERASWRAGSTAKCLPKAVVVMWMLRRRDIPARLVIASLYKEHQGNSDKLHAWVEIDSEFIIGHCDRALYQPLATFGQMRDPSKDQNRLSREAI